MGIVTDGKYLQKGDIWRKGNVYDDQWMSFNSLDLNKYVQSLEIDNPEEAKKVVI